MNKGVIRVKRTGTGAYDTSYQITATPKKDEVPSEKEAESLKLPAIKEYFFDRYGNAPKAEEETSSDDDTSLF